MSSCGSVNRPQCRLGLADGVGTRLLLSVTLSLEVSAEFGPGRIVKFREVPLTALMLPTAGGRWMVAGYLDAGPPRVVGGVRLVRGVGQPRQPADVRLNKWFCKNTENKNRIYQM